MQRALALAMKGRGAVEPNPMVACVIVKDGRVLGEGYHQKFGLPHAEPNALASCREPPAGATAYVTLEPCCHTHKKTPPCVPLLIAARIQRVVVGCLDPNPVVSGRGIEQLRHAGIEVLAPLLEPEAKQLIAPFFARTTLHRPYVTLKWAESFNHRVAGTEGKPIRITNSTSNRLVHELRAGSDAILVGINTVLADDPSLTARDVEHSRPLLRVVLDSRLRLPLTSRLVRSAAANPVIAYCSKLALETRKEHIQALEDQGVRVASLGPEQGGTVGDLSLRLCLAELLQNLPGSHLLVEPGPTLAKSFLDNGMADRIWIFRSPRTIDEPASKIAANVSYPIAASGNIGGDELTEYLNPAGDAFFAMTCSADFERTRGV